MTSAPTRRRLPDRRASETFDIESCGLRFNVTASHFAASLALQFGCPVETLRKALKRDGQGRASSPLGAALGLLHEQSNQAGAV